MWKQFIQNRLIKIRDSLPGIKGLHCLCFCTMCHSMDLIAEELVNKGKTEEKLSNVILIEKFSDYDKVIRVLCYVRRFIYNCKAMYERKIVPLETLVLKNSKKSNGCY